MVTNEVAKSIDLSGEWSFCLDDKDVGIEEKWFSRMIDNQIVTLPGTTATNKIGAELVFDGTLTKANVQNLKQYHKYIGVAWYQKVIDIPADWEGKQSELFLERVMFLSQVWIDNDYISSQDSLSTPHVYDLTHRIESGKTYRLTLRIDNRDVMHIGTNPSAFTDETQTIWNGMVGKLELTLKNSLSMKQIKVFASKKTSTLTVKLEMSAVNQLPLRGVIQSAIYEKSTHSCIFKHVSHEIEFTENNQIIELSLDLKDVETIKSWDEFDTNLYELKAVLSSQDQEIIYDDKTTQFGFRSLETDKNLLKINGNNLFLRGTLDCCIFPLTGYPSMDEFSWRKILSTVKEYGLNHVRYHSWCPPEAAFTIADELGLYLQVEGPIWMDNWTNVTVGSHKDHYEYIPAEAERIIDTYGNHPSFCIFSNGNELNGDFDLLSSTIKKLKEKDNRFLYTLTSNWDRKCDEMDDIFITQCVDGVGVRGQYSPDIMVNETDLSFEKAVKLRDIPVISHEVGQYCVYPNISEISKYTGVLRPVNFEAIKLDLEKKNLLKDAQKFTQGSGMLALQLYKDEIEAGLRTEGFGGFQLLDLHDFPGQSTATVGLLDCFWESKGIVSALKFREFCAETVCLLRMKKRCFTHNESFYGDIQVAHFGKEPLLNQTIYWKFEDKCGQILYEGTMESVNLDISNSNWIHPIEIQDLSYIKSATAILVTIGIKGTEIQNTWSIWVYPSEPIEVDTSQFIYATQWNEDVQLALKEGKKVLLVPSSKEVKVAYPGKFFPVFWSPVHFTSKDACGIFCDAAHPVFKNFPTEYYSSYQWKEPLESSISIGLDNLPIEYEMIVQAIPNFFNNHRQGILFEAKVLSGQLFVCSVDILGDLSKKPIIANLKQSIEKYIESEQFNPKQHLSVEDLEQIFAREVLGDDLKRIDLALKKIARSDSEKSLAYGAEKGNDGNPLSTWHAADASVGHWWEVDLGETIKVTGTRVEFGTEANYLYVIQVSEDGENYNVVVNKTGQTSTDKIREDAFDESARYVRIVYNGLPAGVWASHVAFEVFSE